MFRPMLAAATAVAAACLVLVAGAVSAAPKDEIKPIVKFAKTWEAGVAEAKLLNLPIVVHSHGFY